MSETITTEKKAAGKTHRIVTQEAFAMLTTAQGEVRFAKGDDETYTSEPLTQSHAEDIASIEGFDAVEIDTEDKAKTEAETEAKAHEEEKPVSSHEKIPPVHHNRRTASGGK